MTATGLLILAILAATIDLASFDKSAACTGSCLTTPSPPNCNDEKDDFLACVKCCGTGNTKTEFTKHDKCICKDDKGNLAEPNKAKEGPRIGVIKKIASLMSSSIDPIVSGCDDKEEDFSTCVKCCGPDRTWIEFTKHVKCICKVDKGNLPKPNKAKEGPKIAGIKKIASLESSSIDPIVSDCDDEKYDFLACVKCCGTGNTKTEFTKHDKCICKDDNGNLAKPNKPKRRAE